MIIGIVVGFCILVLRKWGAIDYVGERAPILIHNLLNCQLCLSFWASLLFSSIIYIFNPIPLQEIAIAWAITFLIIK